MKEIDKPLDCGYRSYSVCIFRCLHSKNYTKTCSNSYEFPTACPLLNVKIIKTPAEQIMEWKEEIKENRDATKE